MFDSRYIKGASFLNYAENFLAETNTACLIVDDRLNVVAVNYEYQQFHHLFNSKKIEQGKPFTTHHFDSFPDSFNENIRNIIKGNSDNAKMQIEYLGEETSSFTISVLPLSRDSRRTEGACVMVQKTEKNSMSPFEKNEDFYKLIIDSCPNVYILADAALVFTFSSSAIYEILGYSPIEIVGKNAIELVHPDDKELVRDWLISIRRNVEKLYTLEYRIKNKNGKYIWIENNAKNMLNNGSIKSIVMNLRNIQTKKVADDALIQAEQRLSLLLNNTEESFIILNSRLRILTYNKAAQERSPFFYTQELQSGLSVLDLISREEIPEYISLFEQVFKGIQIEKETRFIDALGNLHVYSHTFRPLLDSINDIFGVFITSTDITERKKLTEEVAVHSDRLKTAQKIARLGYVEYDFMTKTLFSTDQFCEILGIQDDLKEWRQILLAEECVHPDDREELKNELVKTIAQGKDFTVEFRYQLFPEDEKVILAKGSSEKNEEGQNIKFKVTLQDITDSKMAILALQTLESKFKSLFDHSIDGVILSKEQGEIISANPAVCKLLGYSQEELTSLTSCDILDNRTISAEKLWSLLKENNGSFVGELLLKDKAGNFVPVEITSISMMDSKENSYISTIIRDITDKKKVEIEQKALTEELLKNNQDLQQFSFITSHNLRAPVANLLSLLSLYNKQNPADDFNQLLIEKFEEATQQLNQTLNDLVNVLVIKSNTNIEREPVSFTDIFIEVKKNVDNLLSQQKGVIKANFSQVDQIQYNKIHLESIFLNMISNAIRYSSPDRQPQINITSYREENWVVVEFEDNGLGMDLNRYGDRLFGLYQRFHGNKEGKGLGLYMTRSQVIAMGGKIEVESEAGKGTKFKIYFKA